MFPLLSSLVHKLQLDLRLYECVRLGCYLTTLFGNTVVMAIAAPKKKRSLLPVLVVLFVVSYGLMTMLIVEQGSVIESQRGLIQLMSADSVALAGVKGSSVGPNPMSRSGAKIPAPPAQVQSTPSTQVPSTQAPSTQAPSRRTPSTQATPQHGASRTGRVAKPGTQAPPIPAADLVDHRRDLVTI